MAYNLLISFELSRPEHNHEKVIRAVKSIGSWTKVHQTFWYVKSDHLGPEAAKIIWEVMDSNDSLCVVDATNNHMSGYKLDASVSIFMKKNWLQNYN